MAALPFGPNSAAPTMRANENGISVGIGGGGGGGSSQLNSLINMLMGRARNTGDPKARAETIDRQQQTQADYDKASAFKDAQALMDNAMNNIMAENMPSMTLAAEGAGASGSSMRALLLQQLTNKAASEAAALGANQAVQYGQISNQAGSVLEQLTSADPAVLGALVNAMQLRNQGGGSAREPRQRQQFDNRRGGGLSSAKNAGPAGTGGLATAVFLPSSNQDASAFFNRDGGILDNRSSDLVSYGPSPSFDPSATLARMQAGLTPMQQWEGVPGASNLYDNYMKF